MKITAFYLAEQIDIRALKDAYAGTLLQENPSELFYQIGSDQYFYALDYGAVVFANLSSVEISQNLAFLQPFCTKPLQEKLRDDLEITVAADLPITFHFDSLTVPKIDENVVRIVMHNIAHSVALDFFSQRADSLLAEIHHFTKQLEQEGAIRISRKNMLRFIGRTLNNKNSVVENLFIFDGPDLIWDDEYLDRIHRGLSRTFELQSRFKEVEYTFKVIEDNMAVFRELYLHRESSQLEWIIIVLICIEVFDLLISKIFFS
ncbi:MAG: RMD1 family protein [Saprospiraceae bacterium]|nr:RMD1 family protein [Saprospiraceae bacterium]